jgi:hypothetical protein
MMYFSQVFSSFLVSFFIFCNTVSVSSDKSFEDSFSDSSDVYCSSESESSISSQILRGCFLLAAKLLSYLDPKTIRHQYYVHSQL